MICGLVFFDRYSSTFGRARLRRVRRANVTTMSEAEATSRPQSQHHATILFDGVCNLCNRSIRTIAENDPSGYFQFAPLDSEAARHALSSFGRSSETFSSIVVIDAAGIFERSDAALRIACYLRFPWPLTAAFFAIPRAWRDAVYAWIANNRYRVFGTSERCPLPPTHLRERFL